MPKDLKGFDAAEHLDTPEHQAAYLTIALESGDIEEVRDAIGIVARARDLSETARTANLHAKTLHKALGDSGTPEFATILRAMKILGLKLVVEPL